MTKQNKANNNKNKLPTMFPQAVLQDYEEKVVKVESEILH